MQAYTSCCLRTRLMPSNSLLTTVISARLPSTIALTSASGMRLLTARAISSFMRRSRCRGRRPQ